MRTAGWAMTRVGGTVSALFFIVGVLDAQAQNLVQNPGFTFDLSGWTIPPGPQTVTWDGAQGSSAPGSVFLSPTSSGSVFVLTQCIPAAASTAYDVGGSFRYPSSVTTTPVGSVLLYYYSDPGCSTGQLALSNSLQLSGGGSPADTWLTQNYPRGVTTPAGTVAVKVHLWFFTFAAGTASAWFDDISFAPSPLNYFTLPPCRVVDTRDLGAPIGGPVLQGQETRPFAVGGNCGIPSGAKAISLNLTATQSSAQGNVALFPAGQPAPTVSTINYVAGQTRANNAVVSLDPSGAMAAFVGQPVGTTVHLVIDVNGYFQ
jgi:hypothetical protein